jgi:hypothetical protein
MSAPSSRVVTLLGGIAGLALFSYAVQRAGAADILDGIRRVGWGVVFVLTAGGVRLLVRAQCWRLCLPRSTPLSLAQAWSAVLAGDALGNVTPLGLFASEPTKVFLTRHHLATRESVASLALETLVYSASVAAMVAVGVGVLMGTIDLSAVWLGVGAAIVASLGAGVALAMRLLHGTWPEARGQRPRWRERLAGVRMAVLGFSAEYRGRLWRVFAWHLLFHALAVLEIYVTLLWLLGSANVTIAQAVVFEALNRVVTVAFKFVPFRVGVDEAMSGALAPVLAVDPASGVTLAVIRKIRNLFWAGAGLAVIAAHPAAPHRSSAIERVPEAPATDPRETASAHRP